MLVEEGADHIIDQLVLRVGDINAEGHNEEDQRDKAELAEKLAYHGERFESFAAFHGVSSFNPFGCGSAAMVSG